MKKRVTVNIEKVLEIEIPDDRLTEEGIAEFSATIEDINGDINEMFKSAAIQYSYYPDIAFIEGIGPVKSEYDRTGKIGIVIKEIDDEIDCIVNSI